MKNKIYLWLFAILLSITACQKEDNLHLVEPVILLPRTPKPRTKNLFCDGVFMKTPDAISCSTIH